MVGPDIIWGLSKRISYDVSRAPSGFSWGQPRYRICLELGWAEIICSMIYLGPLQIGWADIYGMPLHGLGQDDLEWLAEI